MAQVFISYKSQERVFAVALRDQLQAWHYSTWIDIDNIPPGTYFRDAIQNGLETSDVVIGVITPDATSSREVLTEWDFALNYRRFIPLLYRESRLPYHLEGIQYLNFIGFDELETLERRETLDHLNQALVDLRFNGKSVLPPLAPETKQHSQQENTNRHRMLRKVAEYWIDGVLKNVLNENPLIGLGLEAKPDAVLRHVDYGDYPLPPSTQIQQVFNDLHRELLILGAPGAGKTTLMLSLTENLLEAAKLDAQEPIPIVLNLASWAVKRHSLKDWLVERLWFEYQVPGKVGTLWLDNEEIIVLLTIGASYDESELHPSLCKIRRSDIHSEYCSGT